MSPVIKMITSAFQRKKMAYFISRLLCAFYPNNKYEVPTTSGIPTTESELFLKQYALERKKKLVSTIKQSSNMGDIPNTLERRFLLN